MASVTIGTTDYPSYSSVADADAYLAADAVRAAAWALRNPDAKARGLVTATRLLQALTWCGTAPDVADPPAVVVPGTGAGKVTLQVDDWTVTGGPMNPKSVAKMAADLNTQGPFVTSVEVLKGPPALFQGGEVVKMGKRSGSYVTLEDLMDKVEVTTIMGTFQSSLTNYRYVRNVWKRNAEEERLLGVSMTGIMDHEVLSKPSDEAAQWLTQLREHAVKTNAKWAKKLGINASVAITTVKPSGTVSQLVDSASGIHPRYSQHYVRTVRADKKDPLAQFMRAEGFPVEDCVMKPDTTDVFAFPVRGPEHAVFRNDMSAIQQLEHYLMFKRFWCEHNPSITVYVRDHEWLAVGDWVYNNFDDVGGVSFLPHTDHVYQQAPYTECSEAEYEELAGKMPTVAWSKLQEFETEDCTIGTKELACTAGVCEIL